jgi:hypothetical protein
MADDGLPRLLAVDHIVGNGAGLFEAVSRVDSEVFVGRLQRQPQRCPMPLKRNTAPLRINWLQNLSGQGERNRERQSKTEPTVKASSDKVIKTDRKDIIELKEEELNDDELDPVSGGAVGKLKYW